MIDEAQQLKDNAQKSLGIETGNCGLLGLTWNKNEDTVSVTKQGVVMKVAKVNDSLGLASPLSRTGKMLYWETYDY